MQVLRVGAFGDADSPNAVIRAFQRRVEEVRATIPAGRLLEFDVRQGWGPLCAFLGREVPAMEFPHVNDRESLKRSAEEFLRGGQR